jgi:sodium-dependent dicarboxylate transporter 2/3/5
MMALTNMTSNTASTQMILPVLVTLAVAIHVHPLLLMVPATLAASCAFLLPAATPPNAIIFGSDRLTVAQMARSGLVLSAVSVLLITLALFTLGEWVLGIDPLHLPAWANGAGG